MANAFQFCTNIVIFCLCFYAVAIKTSQTRFCHRKKKIPLELRQNRKQEKKDETFHVKRSSNYGHCTYFDKLRNWSKFTKNLYCGIFGKIEMKV